MAETLHEMLGRKQFDLENLSAEYDRLLAVLGQVVSGEIAPERVSVDLTARNWKVEPKADATTVQ